MSYTDEPFIMAS